MKKVKGQKVLAWPPRDFQYIEGLSNLERLGVVYSKLEAISSYFSYFEHIKPDKPVQANDVYGYWFIIRDICDELADILKIDHWTGEIGKKADEGEE
jgi:hypothetical protein